MSRRDENPLSIYLAVVAALAYVALVVVAWFVL